MESREYQRFLDTLEEKYGAWSKATARFGSTSYGEIAKALNISASQFSKLLNGSATEGMYVRTIENIKRLIRQERIRKERDKALSELEGQSGRRSRRLLWVGALSFVLGLAAASFYITNLKVETHGPSAIGHPLNDYFQQGYDAAFDSPYLQESEVQDYCPCSAFEGRWTMDRPFKLPLPGSRQPGLYYLAKKSDLRMRCSNINAPYIGKGTAILGYEFLVSEIWIDTELEPLVPKYFDIQKKTYTPAFENIDFEEEDQFKRVAVLHAFNVNNFEIHPDSIVRRAELTGRYVEELDESLAKEYSIDIRHIVRNVLGNLTKTDCDPTVNEFCDPNDLVEGESVIAFNCMYTIEAENLGLGGGYPYKKEFRLENQHYSDHLTCRCDTVSLPPAK